VQSAQGINPMQPYYFPFVRKSGNYGGGFSDHGPRIEQEATPSWSKHAEYLEGFFDYRPRNEQEATVVAISPDWGKSWIFEGEALGLNPYCPADQTDPDNNNVIVNGLSTPYGSDPDNAGDNGLGHAFVMTVDGAQLIYNLNRANGHIDSDPLVVHALKPKDTHPLASLPEFGYVSPLAAGGYPTLKAPVGATAGLQSPDAILGAQQISGVTTVVYVEKQLGVAPAATQCPSTPSWALTNIDTGKKKKANNDVITIRVAMTTDGINFTDVGAASGLQDPTTTNNHGIRWLGSGSIVPLSNGHYGMFFGAGNCLDNDSDGFHFIGYAETTSAVNKPTDMLSWTIINGFDHPILSTDTVTDPMGNKYPANPPLIDVTGVNVLTPAQVLPWVPPTVDNIKYNTNFFSGRVYDPQAI